MVERNRSKPFVQNDNNVLAIGLLTRETGVPASQRLNIEDEVIALNFDLAVTLRLQRYDLEILEQGQKSLAIRTANAVAWVTGFGGKDPNEEDREGTDYLSQDKYSDENTQIM